MTTWSVKISVIVITIHVSLLHYLSIETHYHFNSVKGNLKGKKPTVSHIVYKFEIFST